MDAQAGLSLRWAPVVLLVLSFRGSFYESKRYPRPLEITSNLSTGVSDQIKLKPSGYSASEAYKRLGHIHRATSYGVYIAQLIWFARVSSNVAYLNTRTKTLTAKLLKQGYRYNKPRIASSNATTTWCANLILDSHLLILQGLLEPEFYGDLVCSFGNIVSRNNFSDQFRKIIIRYALWLTQSRFITLLHFYWRAGVSGLILEEGSGLKTFN